MRFSFESFVLDIGTRELLRDGEPVHLPPKAFDLLAVLIENRPRALGKDDLHSRIWPGTFVSDTSLSTLVNEIRAALNDRARPPRFVRTVHAYGYAFCGVARTLSELRHAAPATQWVRWQDRDFPLAEGENILGRDLGSAVRIDLPSVSRRHASIVVSGGTAIIEDLHSRNGTFVEETALTAPRTLKDGTSIRLGTVVVTFHAASSGATTEAVTFRSGTNVRHS